MWLHCYVQLTCTGKQNMAVRAAEAGENMGDARHSPSREMPLQIPRTRWGLQCRPKAVLHLSEGIILILFMAL